MNISGIFKIVPVLVLIYSCNYNSKKFNLLGKWHMESKSYFINSEGSETYNDEETFQEIYFNDDSTFCVIENREIVDTGRYYYNDSCLYQKLDSKNYDSCKLDIKNDSFFAYHDDSRVFIVRKAINNSVSIGSKSRH